MKFIPLTQVFVGEDTIKEYGCKEKVRPVNAEYITDFAPAHPDDKEDWGINSYVHIRSSADSSIHVKESIRTIWKMIHEWTDLELNQAFHVLESHI